MELLHFTAIPLRPPLVRRNCWGASKLPLLERQVRHPSFVMNANPREDIIMEIPDDLIKQLNEHEEEETIKEEDDPKLQWVRTARQEAQKIMKHVPRRSYERFLPKELRTPTQKEIEAKAAKKAAKLEAKKRRAAALMMKQQLKEKAKEVNEQEEQGEQDEGSTQEALDPEQLKKFVGKYKGKARDDDGVEVREFTENDEVQRKPSIDLQSPQGPLPTFAMPNYSEDEASVSEDEEEPPESEQSAKSAISEKVLKAKAIQINHLLMEATSIDRVLCVTSGRKLYPINVATALHRIAKFMVRQGLDVPARMEYLRDPDMKQLIAAAMRILPKSGGRGIANIAWAFSKIGCRHVFLGEMDMVARAAIGKVDELNAQEVANIAGAFSTMMHSSPLLFEKLSARGTQVAHMFDPQGICQLLWAFAMLGQPADALLDRLDEILEGYKPSDHIFGFEEPPDQLLKPGKLEFDMLSSIAWSYAVLNQLQRPFMDFVVKAIRKCGEGPNRIGPKNLLYQLNLLYQVQLAWKVGVDPAGVSFGEWIDKQIASSWEKEKKTQQKISTLQREVKYYLLCFGKDWEMEVLEPETGYALDIVMKGEKIAVEVHGPTHYTRNSGALLGNNHLKQRILEGFGWNVYTVSYEEWERLDGEKGNRDYLRNLLGEQLVGKHLAAEKSNTGDHLPVDSEAAAAL